MPKRTDIKRILVIGSGPIVIGQACEFDYSGAQACKVLKEDGFEVILVNSNPATIMTDPGLADRTYVEPITAEFIERVIKKERPDALSRARAMPTAWPTPRLSPSAWAIPACCARALPSVAPAAASHILTRSSSPS